MATNDPYEVIGLLAVFGLLIVGLWRFIVWVRDLPVPPDPWGAETTQKLSEPDAVEICHRCLTPVKENRWFCEHCGSAVGPYNNLMPFVLIFSEGEVLRNGLRDRFRSRTFVLAGYLVLTLGGIRALVWSFWQTPVYFLFVAAYWLLLLRHMQRPRSGKKNLSEPEG